MFAKQGVVFVANSSGRCITVYHVRHLPQYI